MNNNREKWAHDLETMYAVSQLFKWINPGNSVISGHCWSTFALSYIFQHCWRLQMQCVSYSSYICLVSLSPFASILRRAIHFTPNISEVLMLLRFCYGQMMTIFGVREGISETSINRLSKRMPMPENNEVKTWLSAKLQRVEIVSEKMMKSRSFCLSQGCSSANQILSGARLLGCALPGNFQEKHEKRHIKILFQNDLLWEKKFIKIFPLFK